MGDTLITVVAIFLAAILMFVFPLMSMSEQSDDISKLAVQTSTTEMVDDIRAKGVVTQTAYDKFVEEITSTGHVFDVEMEIQVLDENVGKKATQTQTDEIGKNSYYSVYSTQIMEQLEKTGKYVLKEGDIVSITVKSRGTSIAQQLQSAFQSVIGNDVSAITAQHAGMVTTNGK